MSTKGFQKLSFILSPPMGNPKYTNEIEPVLQFKTEAAYANHVGGILTPVSLA